MALVKCPDCEKMISPRVQQCPFCGCPAEFFIKDVDSSTGGDTKASTPSNMIINTSMSVNAASNSMASSVMPEQQNNNVNATVIENPNLPVPKDGVVFGFEDEQNPDTSKYPFVVITDPERESDKHAKGKTHVMFRIGESKYLTVSKSDLFFAPINFEVEDKLFEGAAVFVQYIASVTSLNGLTSGASENSKKVLYVYCNYLVQKLVQYGIYDYDFDNFVNACGGEILLDRSDAYHSILRQEDNVDSYAQDLAYQRDRERSSRSQWVGGGFGVKGAIKGAVTAGALNAATGAFRSIGDGITDASDRSNVQSKYNAIVNEKNKSNLINAFINCLGVAEFKFFEILGKKTGWNSDGVLAINVNEGTAKLRNLEHIKDKSTREKILIELLSDYPFMDDAIKYALSNYAEYDFNIGDLLHYVNRLNPTTFKSWMDDNFIDSLETIEKSASGEKRIKALVDHGVTFGVIDNDYNVTNPDIGPLVILHLIEAEMSDNGLSLGKMQDQTKDFDRAQKYFDKLQEIGTKYHVLNKGSIKNELSLAGTFKEYDSFDELRTNINEQLKKICTVRGVLCANIQEAKLLDKEWKEFDAMYSPYDTYADYDSSVMQEIIDKAEKRNFGSKHVKDLIYGKGGLKDKKGKLEERERSEDYKKSQQIVRQMLPYACADLFVYGSAGYLEKAKEARRLDKVLELESDAFPIVICDASDSNGFKGFVVTDKYLYNFNSVLGIGFGDKALGLFDIRETAQNGKNRLFKLSNGKTEKIKIIAYEELLIGTLSEVYIWASDVNRATAYTSNSGVLAINGPTSSGNVEKKPCPICGSPIAINAKFCTFCGNKIDNEAAKEDKKPCPCCGEMIGIKAKFCTFCGATITNAGEDLSEDNIVDEPDNGVFESDELIDSEEIIVEDKEAMESPKIQVCPGCKKEIPINAKFCTFCGYSFIS